MWLSNMPKNTPQIKVSFKLMSVGHRHLLNKNWGCLFEKIWNLLV